MIPVAIDDYLSNEPWEEKMLVRAIVSKKGRDVLETV